MLNFLIFIICAICFYKLVIFVANATFKFVLLLAAFPFTIAHAYHTGTEKERKLWWGVLVLWIIVALLVALILYLG